jgi:heme/copper-type cytochrome/quinol oxidase subunit 3
MTVQWLILIGAYALFLGAMLAFGIVMKRRDPLWASPLKERYKSASRAEKALVWAAVAAAFYLIMGAFYWLGASLGIPDLSIYRHPAILLITVAFGAVFVGLGSLLFVRSPDDEPHDWLAEGLKNVLAARKPRL